MKETVRAWAVHSKPLAKCLAAAEYMKKGAGYQEAQQVLNTFVKSEKRTDRRYVRKLTFDVLFSRIYYQVEMDEYFFYQFEGKTDEERSTYIGRIEKDKLCAEIGDAKSKNILNNKYECYVHFKEFFGRDVIKVSSQEDQAVFEEFASKHKEFMVKPIEGSLGRGICRMATEGMDISECFQKVIANGPCVVEQCLEQVYELAQFHPQSINTIRIATFYNASAIKILFSGIRAGTGDSVVDNMGAGGIFALINTENGEIQRDGYAKDGTIYQSHPDTGCVFKGFQIPRWSDLLDVTLKAAQSFPQYNYISWDFALTDSGWVMVEANSKGTFEVLQIVFGGIREVFMKEFLEYKKTKSGDIENDTQNLPGIEIFK